MRHPLLSLIILMMWPAAALAATIQVPADAPTIQAGINLAAAGDTVQVACGTYLETNIDMKSGVVLRGQPDQPACVVIDCQGAGTGIICGYLDSTTVITGLSITGAFDSAMKLTSAPVRISQVHFVDNESYFGGGISATSSDAVIEHCLFQNNMGYGDGAISMYGSSPTVSDCEFIGNRGFVDGPGAIWCRFSSPTLTRCRFIGNRSDTFAGALYARDASNLTIIDCTFAGNLAPGYPGAISFPSWDATVQVITGSTFQGNEGSSTIRVGIADLSLSNTIIAGNLAPAFAVDDSIPAISCTDIHANEGGDWIEPIAHLLGQDGNIDQDPLFCDAAAGDLGLAAASPCAAENSGGCGLMGAWPVACDIPASAEAGDALPHLLTLAPCSPNPFNPATTISYHLPADAVVNLEIYDVAGRRVRVLARNVLQDSGQQTMVWRGRDDAGRQVGSGIYLCRLEVAGQVRTSPMALVR